MNESRHGELESSGSAADVSKGDGLPLRDVRRRDEPDRWVVPALWHGIGPRHPRGTGEAALHLPDAPGSPARETGCVPKVWDGSGSQRTGSGGVR